MIERKILKHLESAGLERVGNVGEAFSPSFHEAVGADPAPTSEQDHLVASVLQPGYRFGGALLRPARVRVYLWQDGGAGE
jgi:molecular chaperone GrpE (heat shock protein)